MKRKDLKPCALCGKRLMHMRNPIFYRIKIESMIFNLSALHQQAGLEIMLEGGSAGATLAAHMGSDKGIAKKAAENTILLCINCATTKSEIPARLLEIK